MGGIDAAVGEDEGKSRHWVDCEASVGDRPVGWMEGRSGRTGARDDGSVGRGLLKARVVDPSTDKIDLERAVCVSGAPTLQVCTQGSVGQVGGQVG